MKTFRDLKIGTVVSYTDSMNPTKEAVVLDSEETQWGVFVNLLWKEDNRRSNIMAHTKLDGNDYSGWRIEAA